MERGEEKKRLKELREFCQMGFWPQTSMAEPKV
jgi:hypothetical protein